jgi:hypothetical protein
MKKMQEQGKYTKIATIALLFGILIIPQVFSALTTARSIASSGIIVNPNEVVAESGYWRDIQKAVDEIDSQGGGNVIIPAGVFSFVNAGESWSGARVIIPAGVSLVGASNNMDSNGQNTEWRTVLKLPWDVPGSWLGGSGAPPANGGPSVPTWFRIVGDSDPNEHSRFSNIKLVGYRSTDPNSKYVVQGLSITNVVNFRVDHVYFEHITGGGIATAGSRCNGVIDHSYFVNPTAHVQTVGWEQCTAGYGIQVAREYGDIWENDITKVLGKYTDYSVYIEDCYFEKWRHVVAANSGAHYVLRHSTIKNDFASASIDAHGWGFTEEGTITQVGTRAVEIYDCSITNAIQDPWCTSIRGGSGVAFNNIVGGGTYGQFIYFTNEAESTVSKCWINDWYVWNNTMLSGCTEITKYDMSGTIKENVNYFIHSPTTFEYTPYTYPHPLTL